MEKVDVFGTLPEARFGHTLTFISKSKAVLFGGAVGDTGKYSITADTFSFDLVTRVWRKIIGTGNKPSPRAAHGSASVEVNQLVVYGGATGGGSLASDDLYRLDLKDGEDSAYWSIISVVGTTPGRRYGHTLTYVKPFLVVFGGNTGAESVNDWWTLNLEKAPYTWVKHESKSAIPGVRVYHSAALCQTGTATGMVVVFGGRSADQSALNDSWGLRRHRNGTWDWVKAPYKGNDKDQPACRYQHSAIFVGSAMVILGGRTNNVEESVGIEVYDTETAEWSKIPALQRFRHAILLIENYLYIYGGFEQEAPNTPTDTMVRINLLSAFKSKESLYNKVSQFVASSPRVLTNTTPTLSPTNVSGDSGKSFSTASTYDQSTKQNSMMVSKSMMKGDDGTFKITEALITSNGNEYVKTMSLGGKSDTLKTGFNSKYLNLNSFEQSIHMIFLEQLLKSRNMDSDPNAPFPLKSELIIALCDQAEAIMQKQPIVLKVRAPVKIFGDIHGQYTDLMRFFDLWGCPYEGNGVDGDIESFDYLFLGDYVDRGSHSLETICLLLALKVRYPDQMHLLRGNHEDKWINNGFGFSDECINRLGEDPLDEDSVFSRINRVFDWLPLAAVVDDKILCLHGGIGSSLTRVEDIDTLRRPLEVIHEVSTPEQQLVVDILWSDPTDSDTDLGIQANTIRDPGGTGNIVKFGPDTVQKFLKSNNLSLIVRAHECVMDGFERFAGGQLITVFSATDYCGRHKNAGAVLIMKKNFEIIPKLIYPQTANYHNWIENEEALKKRPPTPPRWKNNNQNNSRKSSYE